MALKSTHRSGSPVTLCLILLLSIAFLSPLYHSHNHTQDYHQEDSGDHVLLHDGSDHEGLSAGQQHNGSHLHVKKDIGRTDTHPRFEGSSLTRDLCAVTESSAFTEYLSYTLIKHTKALIFRSNSRACLSGLSPPAA
jgi:hypothetical protein